MTVLAILLYLGAIVSANLLTAEFGPAVSIINAFFLIGLDLSLRDYLHEVWQKHRLAKLGALIWTGSAITILLNVDALQIALASAAAFGISATLDALVYQRLLSHPYLVKSNGSNAVGALTDSILFPVLAFGGFPIMIIAGQFAAKLFGGFVWSLGLNQLRKRVAV